MIVRPLDPARDLDGYLRVLHHAEPSPRTGEEWWERQRQAPPNAFRRHLVGDRDGVIVATAMVVDSESPANSVTARVVVDRAHRGVGLGRAMAAAAERLLAERGPGLVETRVADEDVASREWAERRGFRPAHRVIRSRLELADFDAARHQPVLDSVRAAGLVMERPDDPDRLYALYARLVLDVPIQTEPIDRDVFVRQLDEPDVVVLVVRDGSTWVANATVRPVGEDGAWNAFTGVLPAYRGRGLARALKVATTGEVARRGRSWIGTSNHAVNAPMLAVNRALGYRPVATTLFLRRSGEPRDHPTGAPVAPPAG